MQRKPKRDRNVSQARERGGYAVQDEKDRRSDWLRGKRKNEFRE